MDDPLTIVFLVALLGEALIQGLKPLLDPLFALLPLPADVNPYLYLSAALGVALAFFYQADMVSAVGLAPHSWVGMIATGLITGRGSNAVHDVIALLMELLAGLRVRV